MRDMILVLNAGSSSLKFALFPSGAGPTAELTGSVERIGQDAQMTTANAIGQKTKTYATAANHGVALNLVADTVLRAAPDATVSRIGHRIVHGGANLVDPVAVTDDIFDELRALTPLAPLHVPHGLMGIEVRSVPFPGCTANCLL